MVGPVPPGCPGPRCPTSLPDDVLDLLLPALGVAFVAYTDNILTARAFAPPARRAVDANQEFLALGAANIGAGLLHGFPVSSSASRTAIGDAVGARTQLADLVTVALLRARSCCCGPVLAAFPPAALGALVVYAAVRLVDVAEFRRLAAFRRSELAARRRDHGRPCWWSACSTACWSRSACRCSTCCGGSPGRTTPSRASCPASPGMHDVDDYPEAPADPRADGLPLRLAAVLRQRRGLPPPGAGRGRRTPRAPGARGSSSTPRPTSRSTSPPSTRSRTLRRELTDRGIVFALARVKQDLRDAARRRPGCSSGSATDRIFPTLPTAVEAYRAWRAEHA